MRWTRFLRTATVVARALEKLTRAAPPTREPLDGQRRDGSAARHKRSSPETPTGAAARVSCRRSTRYPAIAIEDVQPELDGGQWPIKRVVGDSVEVSADIFKEGHDLLQARVIYRAPAEPDWHEAPMRLVDNDRWAGTFSVDRNTRYVYSVLAFTDVYGSWRADLQKRLAAAQDVTLGAARRPAAGRGGRRALHRRRPIAAGCRRSGALAVAQRPTASARPPSWRFPPSSASVMDRWPDRVRRDPLPPRAAVGRRSACGALRRLVRDLPALAGHRPDAQRDVPRGRGAPAGHRRDGLRHAVHDADPPDRDDQSQGAEQQPGRRPERSRQPVRHRRRRPAGTTRSRPSSARSTTSCTSRQPRAQHGLELALDFAIQVLARPSVGRPSTRSGSITARTARSSSPRIRPRSTRTSTRSTSARRTGRTCGRRCATSFCCGPSAACASSASTIRTPSRSAFWEWLIREVQDALSRTRSSWPRRSRGRR